MNKDSLTITDNRTGKTYEVPILYGTYPEYGAAIRTADLKQIKVSEDDFGLLGYDPSYLNTGSCQSSVTFIDGEKGILRYRGYPIEQLAQHSTYLETSYLLLYGELPAQAQLDAWNESVMAYVKAEPKLTELVSGFGKGSHAMGMMVGVLGSLSTFYDNARDIDTEDVQELHIRRLMGIAPVAAAAVYRQSQGLPVVDPDPSLGFCANYLKMLFEGTSVYRSDPALERALEVLLILHADHEQNCSASTMRGVGSSGADPYSAAAGAAGALYGPAHGGANEAVLKMLNEIGSVDNIPAYIKRVYNREVLLQGFGHRVYKNYDPRAAIIKKTAEEVFEVTGKNPLIDIAVELERIALEEEFFISRSLYPNVDFYSGIIYQAMGLPTDMMTVMFAVGRMPGWLAQWKELMHDPEQRIARPRQIYMGEDIRDYTPMGER
ncbi:MAG: citrate synthase [Gemmatimonadetes bacterium]|nr:citrate synthase [Gemmatimonadota bacterium]